MDSNQSEKTDSIDTFVNTKGHPYRFLNCDICDAQCCDGRRGSVHLPLLLDDFNDVYTFFPILFVFGEKGFLSACALLNDGNHYCRYIKNNECTIYDKRPSPCRFYPLSPHLNNEIYVDTNCPAVGDRGTLLLEAGQINPAFHHPCFDDYQHKLIATYRYFKTINKPTDFECILKLGDVQYYRYIGSAQSNYISMHRQSLKLLNKG